MACTTAKKVPKGISKADKEFLRAVEKQFQLYGDSLKIQVKRENITSSEPGKGKRTVESSYGYGFNGGSHQQNSYHFSQPKFEVYPYSQHDLVPQAHHIEAYKRLNHGFNLQQNHGSGYSTHSQIQDFGGHQSHGGHQSYGGHEDQTVPVIVLRVPGPPAYAAHLQALLQAYILSRTEQLRQQHRTLSQSYGTRLAAPLSHYEPSHKQHVQVHNVEQSNQVLEQHEVQHPVQHSNHYLPVQENHQQKEVVQYYQTQQQAHEEPSAEYGVPEQQVQYVDQGEEQVHQPHNQQYTQQEQVQYVLPQQNYALQYVSGHHHQASSLPTNENYPSESHTQVIFPTHQQYLATRPKYAYVHHDISGTHEEPPASPAAQYRESMYLPHVGGEKGPYNYHAHTQQDAQGSERVYSREQYRKYNQLIAKLRRGLTTKQQ